MGILLVIMLAIVAISILGFGWTLLTTYYMRTPKNFILLTIAIAGFIWLTILIKNFIATEGWLIF